VDRPTYDDYVRRFNARDVSAFERYLAPDVTVQNGHLHFQGVQGMKDHYARIWRCMNETLRVRAFVSDGATLAVHLQTHFAVLRDEADTPFGAVSKGEAFDYDGIVLYRVHDGRIVDIKVSYLDFVKTAADGVQTSLGIVH
jgi:ketosteroid isomerase-like protein